jgi:hypothetical protein
MRELVKIIENYRRESFFDEDENSLIVELRDGATIESIAKFELDNNIKLPDDLKELLLFSNGIDLFGIHINSLEEMEYFSRSSILTFHNWGNGDFDCLSLGGDYPRGSILLMFHSEDKLALVSNSLTEWFTGVIAEIKRIGALLHPLDYNERESEGMYKSVSHQID